MGLSLAHPVFKGERPPLMGLPICPGVRSLNRRVLVEAVLYNFGVVPQEGALDFGLEGRLIDRRITFIKLGWVSFSFVARLCHALVDALMVSLGDFDARTSDHIRQLKSLVDALIGVLTPGAVVELVS